MRCWPDPRHACARTSALESPSPLEPRARSNDAGTEQYSKRPAGDSCAPSSVEGPVSCNHCVPAPTPRKWPRCRRRLVAPRLAVLLPWVNNNGAVRYGDATCKKMARTGCVEPVENDKKKRNPGGSRLRFHQRRRFWRSVLAPGGAEHRSIMRSSWTKCKRLLLLCNMPRITKARKCSR